MSKTLFFTPKNPRLAKAISIKSPTAFRQSIKKVRGLRGFKPSTKRMALVAAKNRAKVQLRRKSLSMKERRQFSQIAKINIPRFKK